LAADGNGWQAEDYVNTRRYYFDRAIDLIKFELPFVVQSQKSFFENIKDTSTNINVGDVMKSLNREPSTSDKGSSNSAESTTE
jgi:O-acetylhomoserine/O-acetylserine sulfhydrylase-like pyridoxal-dependent enzyme